MYDTILTSEYSREIRRAFLLPFFQRFFAVFLRVVYVVDIQCDMQFSDFLSCLLAVKNRAKGFQDSQSCLATLTISPSHFDCFAASL